MKQNTFRHIKMKYIATLLITTLFAAASAEAKPLKVFILAGQSNMGGMRRFALLTTSARIRLRHPCSRRCAILMGRRGYVTRSGCPI